MVSSCRDALTPLWKLYQVGFGIDNLKVCLHIFVVYEYHNSPPKLFASEEHNSDTCSRGNVLWFNISSC